MCSLAVVRLQGVIHGGVCIDEMDAGYSECDRGIVVAWTNDEPSVNPTSVVEHGPVFQVGHAEAGTMCSLRIFCIFHTI